MMRNDKTNVIVDKTFNFALQIVDFSEQLFETKRYALANQIFKCGTSIGANVHEAQNAESRKQERFYSQNENFGKGNG